MTKPFTTVGLDLGQARDYTALVVNERTIVDGVSHHATRHIERMALGTSYPAIVDHVTNLVGRIERPKQLAIDATGVGRPVVEMFQQSKLGCKIVPIVITGGESTNRDGATWRVPKRELASIVQVLLQSERLRIAKQLPMAALLTEELLGFKVKISLNGHDSYGAGEDWRSAQHDDLVLALAIACWAGERGIALASAAVPMPMQSVWN